ncbi:hypothetical protein LTR37_005688 [Vermiconidia calcicola]|uniref:Uncharacterized protein n=1 Tax=Vermiconidia calcicola TaxID=1690605 RepID=A0ACC3NIV2_9PEZI|nr:hypothetical protein LTR37_005688 [Vermiconidia calcicola]
MAQKSLKTLAARNARTLNRTHLISLAIHLTYLLTRTFLFPRKPLPYALCSFPALGIEYWFERIGRPTHTESGEVKRAGEDLEAKGLTEWMWDVLYWTWGVVVLVVVLGDWCWWGWGVVPVYSAFAAWRTYSGVRGGMGGLMGAGGEGGGSGGGQQQQSKRQAKMEKRGGQPQQKVVR